MWSLSLFAPLFADSRDPLQSPEVIWGVVGLAAALFVGAGVIYAVDKWRKRAATVATEADEVGTLTSYRDMYENGEITEAEYAELRRRVADKVKKPGAPPPPPAPGPDGRPAVPPAPVAKNPPDTPVTKDPPAPPPGPTESPPPPSTA
jgi:hypothetical protein